MFYREDFFSDEYKKDVYYNYNLEFALSIYNKMIDNDKINIKFLEISFKGVDEKFYCVHDVDNNLYMNVNGMKKSLKNIFSMKHYNFNYSINEIDVEKLINFDLKKINDFSNNVLNDFYNVKKITVKDKFDKEYDVVIVDGYNECTNKPLSFCKCSIYDGNLEVGFSLIKYLDKKYYESLDLNKKILTLIYNEKVGKFSNVDKILKINRKVNYSESCENDLKIYELYYRDAFIDFINVEPEYKGRGLGTIIYFNSAKSFSEKDVDFRTSFIFSNEGTNLSNFFHKTFSEHTKLIDNETYSELFEYNDIDKNGTYYFLKISDSEELNLKEKKITHVFDDNKIERYQKEKVTI